MAPFQPEFGLLHRRRQELRRRKGEFSEEELYRVPQESKMVPKCTTHDAILVDIQHLEHIRAARAAGVPYNLTFKYDKITFPWWGPHTQQAWTALGSCPEGVPALTNQEEYGKMYFHFLDAGAEICNQSESLKATLANPRAAAAISSAWNILSVEDRGQLMLEICSTMPNEAQADFRGGFSRLSGCNMSGTYGGFGGTSSIDKARMAGMLPQLNVSELAAMENLTDFLKRRVASAPSDHAADDFQAMQTGLLLDTMNKAKTYGAAAYNMLVVEGDGLRPGEYGKMLFGEQILDYMQAEVDDIAKLKKNSEEQGGTTFIRNRRQLWMGQPVHLLFSAQGILYSIWLRLVNHLMAQVDSVEEIGKELGEASPESSQSQFDKGPSTEADAIQRAEFLDIFGPTSVALNMVQERIVELEHHIKALRTDPEFFREQLHSVLAYHACVEDRNLWLPINLTQGEANRAKARNAREARAKARTSTVVDDVMVSPHLSLSLWQGLSFQLTRLHEECRDLVNDPRPAEESKHKLAEVVYWILSTINTLRIRTVQKVSKRLSDGFKYWEPVDHEQPGHGGNLKKERRTPYLLSCLADPGFCEVFGMHNVCEFIGNEGFDDQAFTADWHIGALEDLLSLSAVSGELFRHDSRFWQHSALYEQLRRRTPDTDVLDRFPCYRWAAPYLVAFPANEDPSKAPGWHGEFDIRDIKFIGGNFNFPKTPVTLQDFNTRIEAEVHHRALWDAFDARLEVNGTQENWNLEEIFEPEAIKEWITDWDSGQRFHELTLSAAKPVPTQMPSGSDWSAVRDNTITSNKGKGKQLSLAASSQNPNVDFQSYFSGTEKSVTRADFSIRGKDKVKSRPTAGLPVVGDADNARIVEQEEDAGDDPPLAYYIAEHHDPDNEPARITILLPSKHYITMTNMFAAGRPSVKCEALMKALGKMGFSLVSIWGSMWKLVPPDDFHIHPINVHLPHIPELPPRVRQNMARRMTQHWGWNSDTFERQ